MTRRGGAGRRGTGRTPRDRRQDGLDEGEPGASPERPNMPPRQVSLFDLLTLLAGASWIDGAIIEVQALHIQSIYFRIACYLLALVIGGALGIFAMMNIYRASAYIYRRVIEPGELRRSERRTRMLALGFLFAPLVLWLIIGLVLGGQIMKLIVYSLGR